MFQIKLDSTDITFLNILMKSTIMHDQNSLEGKGGFHPHSFAREPNRKVTSWIS